MATARRDTLLELQARAQKKWADEKTFEVSAPKDGASARRRPSPVVVVVVVVVVRRDSSRDRRSIDRRGSERSRGVSSPRALPLSLPAARSPPRRLNLPRRSNPQALNRPSSSGTSRTRT
jgi:hypothetical protein